VAVLTGTGGFAVVFTRKPELEDSGGGSLFLATGRGTAAIPPTSQAARQ
jgi:hypothetical protein